MGLPSGIFNTNLQQDMAVVRTKTQWLMLAAFLGVLFALSTVLPSDWLVWMILLGFYVVAVLGLHLMTGLCGQFSMGHAAFIAVGAYTVGILAGRYGISSWATLPLAGVFAGLVGLVFGIPALRIKGFYLVMSTIAAQFIIIYVLQQVDWFGGRYGLDVPNLPGIQLGNAGDYQRLWWVTLGMVVLMVFFAKNIQRTALGRRFVAVRDNDLAAEVMGINLFRTKLLAFFIGCFFAGVAGWLWAHFMGHVTPVQFNFTMSLWLLGMLIVGGIGSTTGAILGAAIIRLADKLVDYISPLLSDAFPGMAVQMFPAISLMIFALVVMLFISFNPKGAYHTFESFKLSYRKWPFSY